MESFQHAGFLSNRVITGLLVRPICSEAVDTPLQTVTLRSVLLVGVKRVRMGMSRNERDRQPIGRNEYVVFMRGTSVVMTTSKGKVECRYESDEALALLAWLYLHREELYSTALVDEALKTHRCTAAPHALSRVEALRT